MAKKYKVELNSNDNLQDLLQEVYLLAEEQIIQTAGMIVSTDAIKKVMHLNKESNKTTKSMSDGFKHALRNILRYGFGIRSLSSAAGLSVYLSVCSSITVRMLGQISAKRYGLYWSVFNARNRKKILRKVSNES